MQNRPDLAAVLQARGCQSASGRWRNTFSTGSPSLIPRHRWQTDARSVKSLDLAIALARKQDGVLTNRQASELGLTRSSIDNLIKRHRWKRPSPGVLLVPDICDNTERIRARAAVLMYPYGNVSHRSA